VLVTSTVSDSSSTTGSVDSSTCSSNFVVFIAVSLKRAAGKGPAARGVTQGILCWINREPILAGKLGAVFLFFFAKKPRWFRAGLLFTLTRFRLTRHGHLAFAWIGFRLGHLRHHCCQCQAVPNNGMGLFSINNQRPIHRHLTIFSKAGLCKFFCSVTFKVTQGQE
jgi:hypothetical protein